MRRPTGMLVACVLMVLPLSLPASLHAQAAAGAQSAAPAAPAAAPQKVTVTFDTDVVLWAFEVKADKTADYDKVLAQLKDSLQKITRPEAKQQLAGWKVIKNSTPQGDGSILYVHVLSPVVKGADYSIMNLVYEAFPAYADQRAFYDLYSGSVLKPYFAISGATTDFTK